MKVKMAYDPGSSEAESLPPAVKTAMDNLATAILQANGEVSGNIKLPSDASTGIAVVVLIDE